MAKTRAWAKRQTQSWATPPKAGRPAPAYDDAPTPDTAVPPTPPGPVGGVFGLPPVTTTPGASAMRATSTPIAAQSAGPDYAANQKQVIINQEWMDYWNGHIQRPAGGEFTQSNWLPLEPPAPKPTTSPGTDRQWIDYWNGKAARPVGSYYGGMQNAAPAQTTAAPTPIVYETSPEINQAWMDYWNGKGARPPSNTYYKP
jgi:hypothetical protein